MGRVVGLVLIIVAVGAFFVGAAVLRPPPATSTITITETQTPSLTVIVTEAHVSTQPCKGHAM